MPRRQLRVGDEVANLPHEHATAELVCEIAKIQHVNAKTIHLENGRIYSKVNGRGITPRQQRRNRASDSEPLGRPACQVWPIELKARPKLIPISGGLLFYAVV